MVRPVSQNLLEAFYAQESSQLLVILMQMSYEDWESDVFIVRDSKPLTSGGIPHVAFPFQVSLPDDTDEGMPVLKFRAQNVSREIIGKFRSVVGDVNCTVTWVLRSTPDVVEAGPFEVVLRGIEYDAQTINGVLALDPILEEPFGYLRMTPGNTPAIF